MLDVVDKVTRYLRVTNRQVGTKALILEGLVLKQLLDLELLGVLPLGIAIFLINLRCLLVVSRDLETVLVYRSGSIAFEARLVDHSGELLWVLDVSSAFLPSGCVKEVIPLCIQ